MTGRLHRAVGACLVFVACKASAPPIGYGLPPPPRPADCQTIELGDDLGAALRRAAPGDTLCLGDGTFRGGDLVVPDGVRLWGSRAAVITSDGTGSTVTLSSRSALEGLTVEGSGHRFDVMDSAIHVVGDDIRVEGVLVAKALFGILVERSKRAQILGNTVLGRGGDALGMRGDGIRLWEASHSVVRSNVVTDSRDCVVWYSSDNIVEDNLVRNGRYGMHFMYSHRNHLERNTFEANEVGVFAMYSRDLTMQHNVLSGARGVAGIGLGIKESGNLHIVSNAIVNDTLGIFIDNSPLSDGDKNEFTHNDVRMTNVGVELLSSHKNNVFSGNRFTDNRTQVRVDGGGDASAVTWDGNYWSDYTGYDLDSDGVGDLSYELKDLGDVLESRYPQLAFLRGTPALAFVALAGEVAPIFSPKPVLTDHQPRMTGAASDAH